MRSSPTTIREPNSAGGGLQDSALLTTDYTDGTDFLGLDFWRTTRWEGCIRLTRAAWGDEIGSQTPNSMRAAFRPVCHVNSPYKKSVPSMQSVVKRAKSRVAPPWQKRCQIFLVIVGFSACFYGQLTAEGSEENEFRATVLKSIDKLPTLEANKDRFREVFTQAKDLALLLTVSFATANSKVTGETVKKIKSRLAEQEVQERLKDPAVFLVVVGFGDHRGTEEDRMRGMDLSELRIQSVLYLLSDECEVHTDHYSVPMGRIPEDPEDYYKSRVVEVWSIRS
jgi:hypothetical protein